jgi:hypothetical protein
MQQSGGLRLRRMTVRNQDPGPLLELPGNLGWESTRCIRGLQRIASRKDFCAHCLDDDPILLLPPLSIPAGTKTLQCLVELSASPA